MALIRPYLPLDIDDARLAFTGSVVADLMPAESDIPSNFRVGQRNIWNRFIREKFFLGLSSVEMDPKAGIDPEKAWRHISAILGSWEPKHQHKEAACAYLMSLWYEDVRWKPAK